MLHPTSSNHATPPWPVLTAAVGLPLLALAVVGPTGGFGALVVVAAGAGGWEMARLLARCAAPAESSVLVRAGGAAGAALVAGLFGLYRVPSLAALVACVCAVAAATLAIVVLRSPQRIASAVAAWSVCGAFVGLPLGMLLDLRAGAHGIGWIALAIGVTWLADAAACFVGRSLGRRPLAPALSPGKTLEGAAAGLVVAGAASLALRGRIPELAPPALCLAVGVGANVVGQLGDLFESALKRAAGVKDSGRGVPGYGGVLDKIDSLLFAAPWLLVWQRVLGGGASS